MSIAEKILLGIAGLLGSQAANSQQLNLNNYAAEQKKIQQNGIKILAGWAGINLISGTYFTSHTSGATQNFHRMNMYWNVVNGTLAGFSLWRLHKQQANDNQFASIYKRQQNLEKTFLINAGLDVAYMAGGLYLNERSKNDNRNQHRLKGFGNSVVLQGGFLLVFDGIMYSLMHQKGKKLEKVLENVQITSTGNTVSLLVKL